MKIIVLEGPDKLGKTTQAKRISEATGAEYIKFPNEKLYSGRVLREILNGKRTFEPVSFQALQTMNRLETVQTLDPDGLYIFDRWTASSAVYGEADGVDPEWIRDISALLPVPDIEFIFYGVPFGNDGDIYGEKQERIRGLYDEYIFDKNFLIAVDANRPAETITGELIGMISALGLVA